VLSWLGQNNGGGLYSFLFTHIHDLGFTAISSHPVIAFVSRFISALATVNSEIGAVKCLACWALPAALFLRILAPGRFLANSARSCVGYCTFSSQRSPVQTTPLLTAQLHRAWQIKLCIAVVPSMQANSVFKVKSASSSHDDHSRNRG